MRAGTQFVDIRANVNGGYVGLGDGDDTVVIRGGSVLDGVDFGLGDGDDYFMQKAGATFRNVDVRGEDGSDRLEFAGHNEDTYVNPGRNKDKPDVTVFHASVTGDIDLADPENWKVKPKDETEWGKDVLMLAGDWEGRDGDRYNTNLFGGRWREGLLGLPADVRRADRGGHRHQGRRDDVRVRRPGGRAWPGDRHAPVDRAGDGLREHVGQVHRPGTRRRRR